MGAVRNLLSVINLYSMSPDIEIKVKIDISVRENNITYTLHTLTYIDQVVIVRYVHWNLWFNTNAFRDQPLMRDHFSRNLGLHFYILILTVMKDHLSYKTTFCVFLGGLKCQVSLYMVSARACVIDMCCSRGWL